MSLDGPTLMGLTDMDCWAYVEVILCALEDHRWEIYEGP